MGVVRMVDKVVKSTNSSLGVRCMKATFMDAGIKGGKLVIREQIATRTFMPDEPSTLLEHTQEMHVEMKSFLETDFASYLHLGELDTEGLCQLCNDPNA